MRQKDYSWNPRTGNCENGKYLRGIADTLVIVCDEIITAAESASTNVTNAIPTNKANTIPANVTRTVPINSGDKNVRYKMDCYILRIVLSVIVLLSLIANICYPNTKHRSKQKRIGALTI